MKLTFFTTCCVLAAASQALAQAGRNGFPVIRSREAMKSAQEAARVLEQAKANGVADLERRTQEQSQAQRLEGLMERAQQRGPTQPTYAEQTQAAESAARLDSAMSRLSPEGQVLLAQSNNAPSMRSPDDAPVTSPAVKASPLTTAGGGPKPQPLKPTPLTEKPKAAPAKTVITATGSLFFDSREGFGVYVENVVVNHPQFHMTCDELQVFMNKEKEKGPDGKPTGAATTPPPPKAPTASELLASGAAEKPATAADSKEPDDNSSSLDRAIGKGRRVVITKMSDKGELQIGIGREADYDGKTGDMILRGMPQIQDGQNLTVATSPSTYFLIKRNGQFKSFGPSETHVIQKDEKKGPKGAPNGAVSVGVAGPAVPAAPGAGPAPVMNTRTQGGQQ